MCIRDCEDKEEGGRWAVEDFLKEVIPQRNLKQLTLELRKGGNFLGRDTKGGTRDDNEIKTFYVED